MVWQQLRLRPSILPLAISLTLICLFCPRISAQDVGKIKFASPAPKLIEQDETDQQRTLRLFHAGEYENAAASAKVVDAEMGEFSVDQRWLIIAINSEMEIGKFADALKTLDAALTRFPSSIRIRWVGIDVCRFNKDSKRATGLIAEIKQLIYDNSWQYRDAENQLVVSKILLAEKLDAKKVIDRILNPAKKRNPRNAYVFAEIGNLALDKHDFGLAAENFATAIDLEPGDADLQFGLAQAYQPSDHEKSTAAIEAALKLNPNHTESLLQLVDRHIGAENYLAAEKLLEQVHSINPHHPVGWAYHAVLAHLNNEPTKEGQARNKGLTHWAGNPIVDHLIGRELSQKYRFEESVTYQRRSLVYDPDFLPAKMQLAHDLLRLGQELEGWKLADEVFDADQYSVVAHNLVTLRENLSKFRTLKGDGFVVRMETEESYIYGPRVLELLSDAKEKLTAKYDVELTTPVFIEIFPRQQDFAIRTFGLPGGDGFLGVCFGRLVTMNSPAAQGANLTSWESVLWHEFCHVVTLQKTKNRMPRWLSEGISVYEERLADPAWGESINPIYRKMLLDDDLTPISELSGAFLSPPSPVHLQFAYFESSLVVEFLVEKKGIEAINNVLNELANGTPINDALRRHIEPIDFLDKQFSEFAKDQANSFAANANWDAPELSTDASATQWEKWNSEHPRNVAGLFGWARAMMKKQDWEGSLKRLAEVLAIDPNSTTAMLLQTKVFQKTGDKNREQDSLERLVKLDADNVEALIRLLEITSTNSDWEKTKLFARRLLAINPLIPTAHRYLSLAAEKTTDDLTSIESLSVLVRMNPLDAADVNFRLASALFRQKELKQAKRHALIALEQAPRYRDAHQLLLKIVESENSTAETPSSNPSPETHAGSTVEPVVDSDF